MQNKAHGQQKASICELIAAMKAKLVNIRKGITEQNTKHHAPFKSTSQILHPVPAPHLKKFILELE